MIDCAAIYGLGLAAGRRPLTGDAPPALAAVGGISLLDHALDRLAAQGVRRAVASAHHHRARLEEDIARRGGAPRTEILAEPEPLGSAAALAAAARRLGDGPFYAVAADQIWFDGFIPALARLARKWDPERMDALILLQPTARATGYGGRGDFFLEPGGQARPRGAGEIAGHAFCGVSVLNPRALAGAHDPHAAFEDVLAGLAEAGRLRAIAHDGEWCPHPDRDAVALLEVAIGYRPVPAAAAERLSARARLGAPDPVAAAAAAAPPRRRVLLLGGRRRP